MIIRTIAILLVLFVAAQGGVPAEAACPENEAVASYGEELGRLRSYREKLEGALNSALTALNPQWGGGSCDNGLNNDWNDHPVMLCGASSGEIYGEARFEIRAFGNKDVAKAYWSDWCQAHPDYDRSREEDDWVYYRKLLGFSGLPAKEEAFGRGSQPEGSPDHIMGDVYIRFGNLFVRVGHIYRRDKNTLLSDLWFQASTLLAELAQIDEALKVYTMLEICFDPEINRCVVEVKVLMFGESEPTIACSVSDGLQAAPLPLSLFIKSDQGDGFFYAIYLYNDDCLIDMSNAPTLYTLTTSVTKEPLAATNILTLVAPKESPADNRMYIANGSTPFEPYPPTSWGTKPAGPPYPPEREVYEMTGSGDGQVAVSVLGEAVTDFDGSVNLAVLSDPLFMGEAHTLQEHGTTEINTVTGDIIPSGGFRARTQGILEGLEYYGFFVSPLGTYRIVHHAGGVSTPVVDWTQSDAITSGYGAWNQLRMVRAGGALKFYGNGVLLHTIESPAFSQGIFGLYATDSDDPQSPARVQFDHIAFLGTLVEPRVRLEVQKPGAGAGTVTSTPAGISCGTDCRQYYKKNTVVTLSAAAEAGSAFTGWGGACSGTGGCTVTMDGDRTVTATFSILAPPRTLTVTKTGSGTVTGSPAGISCGTDCSEAFAHGTTVSLTATPETGWTFGGWGGACSGTAGCTVTMDSDRTVTADFFPTGAINEDFGTGSVLAWIDDGSGRWSVSGGAYVMTGNKGNSRRFTLYDGTFCDVKFHADVRKTAGDQPGTNWTYGLHFRGDADDGTYYSIVISADGKYMIGKRVDGAFTILVNWTASSALVVGHGQWNTLTIEAVGTLLKFFANGALLASLTDSSLACGRVGLYAFDGNPSGAADRVEFDNVAIIPVAAGVTQSLTVTRVGQGTVSSSPAGIDCGLSCSSFFVKGAPVTLTAIPAPGYDFTYYTGGCSSVDPLCSLSLAADTTVAARFVSKKAKKVNLVVAKTKTSKGDGTVTSADGRIACGKDCKESYYPGSPVRLTATALPNSVFASWTGCPSASGDTCSLTLEKNATVRAVFIGPYVLKAQRVLKNRAGGTVVSADGGISCGKDCQESYIYNTVVALTASPDPGSTFTGWTGCDTPSGSTCTVAVNKAKTVKATFDKPRTR